jgi:hypothetical protein
VLQLWSASGWNEPEMTNLGDRGPYPHGAIVFAVLARCRSQRRSRRFKSDHLHAIPPETAFFLGLPASVWVGGVLIVV